MPDEIKLRGGTPFMPVGTDVAEDGEAFVMVPVYDEPVDIEPGEDVVVDEGTGLVPLAGDGDEPAECALLLLLLVGTAASSTWRR